jgi:vancomycin permeability regulator SanA
MKKYIYALLFILLIFVSPFLIFQINYRFINKTTTQPKVAIVFGAGLINGYPSKVLASRLDESIKLYKTNQISKILVSGDNRVSNYNEPQAMTQYLIDQGIVSSDIIQDFAGLRTVDTCYRAKNVFNVSSAYLISQPFHLPRAMWVCNKFGIETITVGAKNLPLSGTIYQYLREIPSSFSALLESINYNNAMPADGSETRIYE